MTIDFIYITFPSADEASKIGRILVEEKLASCVNILPQMVSIYQWEGKIEESKEVVLIAKTLSNKFEELEKRVTELHPYDTPCICALPASRTNSDFSNWLKSQLD